MSVSAFGGRRKGSGAWRRVDALTGHPRGSEEGDVDGLLMEIGIGLLAAWAWEAAKVALVVGGIIGAVTWLDEALWGAGGGMK